MLGDNQTIKMAAMESEPDENVQFSDYFAGLDGPAKLGYRGEVSVSVLAAQIQQNLQRVESG